MSYLETKLREAAERAMETGMAQEFQVFYSGDRAVKVRVEDHTEARRRAQAEILKSALDMDEKK
jgi:hypothetical protein